MLEDCFCDIMGKARWGLGITLRRLADATQIADARLAALERGESAPSRSECQAVATALALFPPALWEIAQGEYRPEPVLDAEVVMRPAVEAQANGYLVSLAPNGQSLVVDPGGDAAGWLALAAERGRRVVGILLTHGHRDHSGAAAQLSHAWAAPVLAYPGEHRGPNLIELAGDGVYQVGDYAIHAVACPGHTAGSYAFSLAGRLFVGDALFAGSLGRAASPASYAQTLASGRRLLQFPPATTIYPGHGAPTSVRAERRRNPFLAEAFV